MQQLISFSAATCSYVIQMLRSLTYMISVDILDKVFYISITWFI